MSLVEIICMVSLAIGLFLMGWDLNTWPMSWYMKRGQK